MLHRAKSSLLFVCLFCAFASTKEKKLTLLPKSSFRLSFEVRFLRKKVPWLNLLLKKKVEQMLLQKTLIYQKKRFLKLCFCVRATTKQKQKQSPLSADSVQKFRNLFKKSKRVFAWASKSLKGLVVFFAWQQKVPCMCCF